MEGDHTKSRLINRPWVRAVLWRVLGTLITFVAAWAVTRRLRIAMAVALVEVVAKMLLLPAYEWCWRRVPAEAVKRADYQI